MAYPGNEAPVAGRIVGALNNAESVVLADEGLAVLRANLDVVDPFVIGVVGVDAGIGERSILRDG